MRMKVSILSAVVALSMALATAPVMAQSFMGEGAVVNHNAGSQITGSASNLQAQARGSRFGIPGRANNYAFGPDQFYGR